MKECVWRLLCRLFLNMRRIVETILRNRSSKDQEPESEEKRADRRDMKTDKKADKKLDKKIDQKICT